MKTVKHPRFKDVSKSVPDSQADRWVAAGWELDEPAPEVQIKPERVLSQTQTESFERMADTQSKRKRDRDDT